MKQLSAFHCTEASRRDKTEHILAAKYKGKGHEYTGNKEPYSCSSHTHSHIPDETQRSPRKVLHFPERKRKKKKNSEVINVYKEKETPSQIKIPKLEQPLNQSDRSQIRFGLKAPLLSHKN